MQMISPSLVDAVDYVADQAHRRVKRPFTRNYVDALLIGTPKHQLLNPQEPKAAKGMTVEEISRLEEEMESLHMDFKAIETTYGDNMLNLTVARSYVKKLLENTKVSRFLKTRHEDLFSEFEILAAKELL